MIERIEKDVLLIVSPGRTGTAFLGRHLSQMIEDCWSSHEPDVWDGWSSEHSRRALRWFGPYHVTAGKLIRRTGLRAIGERWISGEWDSAKATRAVIRQRDRFYRSRPTSLIAEANYQWYAILPLLPKIFSSYRVLGVVRNPITWVRSRMNFGGIHDEEDRVMWYGLDRLTPAAVGEIAQDMWDGMSLFERMCWEWSFVVQRITDAQKSDSRIVTARYEDLFVSPERNERMAETLRSVADFGHRKYEVEVPTSLLSKRENVSRARRTSGWDDWTEQQRQYLMEICGPVMQRVGYEV